METLSAVDPRPRYASLNEELRDLCFNVGGYPGQWVLHEQCPCCGGDEIAPLFSKFNIEHWTCAACTLVFVNPYPPDDLLDTIYNSSYYTAFRKYIEEPKAEMGREQVAPFSCPVEILRRTIAYVGNLRSQGTWLDVGGGIGAFAKLVRSTLHDWQVYLNELNRDSVKAARRIYRLDVLDVTADALRRGEQRFDVISSFAVLEHIPRPVEFLADYVELLSDDGLLVVSVPRYSRLNRLVSRDSSPNVIPPYHLSLFNEDNLRTILNRLGLEELHTWIDGPPAFSLGDFVKSWPYFDVKVPTEPRESPECIQTEEYPPDVQRWINVLLEKNEQTNDLFEKIDGGSILTCVARKH